ncbi:Protein phosphatase 2C 70 [Vitis vinifera]|uniref:Protein phosphatase 2C 70 n=1 Tax=Vitis vinifera TaxID=29760 RepID=A0A438F633_VITVI|nr:Protein phosphatase 2C 70 [Vitis vinifera]
MILLLNHTFHSTVTSYNLFPGSVDGKQIKMTEDHRVTSYSERQRIKEIGEPLKDGETRLCGLNLARMLGDKYMKEQDSRFSSEPYISQVVHIKSSKQGLCTTGKMKERSSPDRENSAEKVANFLLSEARTLRTKDNTSIIFLDFDTNSRKSSCKLDP